MKLDEALEVLNEASAVDLQLRKTTAVLEHNLTEAASAIVLKTFLEHKARLINNPEGDDGPEEIDRKAKSAAKNIFKSAAGGKPIDAAVKILKASVKREAGALR